jgi:hypothetical protein
MILSTRRIRRMKRIIPSPPPPYIYIGCVGNAKGLVKQTSTNTTRRIIIIKLL